MFFAAWLLTGCFPVSTREAILDKADNYSGKNPLPFYFSEAEVPFSFEVTGTGEWIRLSILSSRHNIGKKALKKGDKLRRKGWQMDAILIVDNFHVKYIQQTDGISGVPSRPREKPAVNSDEPRKELDWIPVFTPPNSSTLPNLRIGAGVGVGSYGGMTFVPIIEGAYRLGIIPNIEVGSYLSYFSVVRGVRRLNLAVVGRGFLDLFENELVHAPFRVYPVAGLQAGLVVGERYQRRNGDWGNARIRIGAVLGFGGEYRINEDWMAFSELQGYIHPAYRNGVLLNVGMRYWLDFPAGA